MGAREEKKTRKTSGLSVSHGEDYRCQRLSETASTVNSGEEGLCRCRMVCDVGRISNS